MPLRKRRRDSLCEPMFHRAKHNREFFPFPSSPFRKIRLSATTTKGSLSSSMRRLAPCRPVRQPQQAPPAAPGGRRTPAPRIRAASQTPMNRVAAARKPIAPVYASDSTGRSVEASQASGVLKRIRCASTIRGMIVVDRTMRIVLGFVFVWMGGVLLRRRDEDEDYPAGERVGEKM